MSKYLTVVFFAVAFAVCSFVGVNLYVLRCILAPKWRKQ